MSNPLGIVNGAVFSDLDTDGFPELIVATEWGAVRVFKNIEGRFDEMTEALGLSGLTGLWQGVATGDFNGDGLMDIVATNWGLNSALRPDVLNPPRLYFNYSESSVPTSLMLGLWDDVVGLPPDSGSLFDFQGLPATAGCVPNSSRVCFVGSVETGRLPSGSAAVSHRRVATVCGIPKPKRGLRG